MSPKKLSVQPFGGNVIWDRTSIVLEVAADRTFESVLRRMLEEHADWVVVVRPRQEKNDVYYYAFRNSELEQLRAAYSERRNWPIERAIDMHGWMSSDTCRGWRRWQKLRPAIENSGPASTRIVNLDAACRVAAVGEREELMPVGANTGGAAKTNVKSGGDYQGDILGSVGGYWDDAFRWTNLGHESGSMGGSHESGSMGGSHESGSVGGSHESGPVGGGHRSFSFPGGVEGNIPLLHKPSSVASSVDVLGPMRGGHGGVSLPGAEAGNRTLVHKPPSVSGAPALASKVEVMLSAEAISEITVGATARVLFQIELFSEASPLAVKQSGLAERDKPIVASLSVENNALEIVGYHEYTQEPPTSGHPRPGFFTVKGVRLGVSRLAVAFRQGGSELGIIGLAVDVVEAGASVEKALGRAVATPRDDSDDDKLALLIEQRVDGGQVLYEYTLHSEALGLAYRRVRSKPLLDRGGGIPATMLAFVEQIYERVTQELKSFNDLKQLQREARGLGVSLCKELFDPEVVEVLWPLRERIKLVQIVSWEPYIPWELVRLCDPKSGDIDERFLCEYGLVRTLSDEMPPRTLTLGRWAYLGATFPMGSYPAVGAELDYFTNTTSESLCGHGIKPEKIAATRDAFYDTLAEGQFDVLHISCHAESPHQSIERASLIIGEEETQPGNLKVRLVEVDTITVEAEARLKQRRPLVFLNACETGRVGAVLTAWGGWPNVFLRKGAGVFVGSAWAVRDKPAATFSTTFYNALLDGKTLAEAASEARAAAKKLGDASWLAFKVYGHPRARRASP